MEFNNKYVNKLKRNKFKPSDTNRNTEIEVRGGMGIVRT